MIYRFEDIEIDTDRFELRRGGESVKVEPQVFALLELLVANHGRLVSKDELNERIWGGRVVSDAVVNSRVYSARLAIGDDGKAQRFIKTIHGRGFRFVGLPESEPISLMNFMALRDLEQNTDTDDAGPLGGKPSIAVLPFHMLTIDDRYALFADAVAHEAIVELSRLQWLFVIARGSSFRFRGPDVDFETAGKVLGVRYFLTGSVAIDGSRSAVTVELSESGGNRVLWAERFESAVDDLLALRLTIAANVVNAIELRIPMNEANRAARLPTESLDAWSAYHRGLWHMYRFNAHDNEIAARMFSRAIDTDRGFARAHAGLSFTHFQNAFIGYTADATTERRLAQEHAERGMELDPLDPFANLTVGRAAMLLGDMDSALSWFDRSVQLNPNYAMAIYNGALVNAIKGAGQESEQGAMKAIALSPVDPLHYAMLTTRALSHIVRGDYAAAIGWAERGARAPNAHTHIRVIAALACELAGDRKMAEYWASEVRRLDSRFQVATFFKAFPFDHDDTLSRATAALKRLAL